MMEQTTLSSVIGSPSASSPDPPSQPAAAAAASSSPPLPIQEDIEKWATHIVGRWWEIFWDPEPSEAASPPYSLVNDDNDHHGKMTNSIGNKYCTLTQDVNQQQQQQQQQQQPIDASPDPANGRQPLQVQLLEQPQYQQLQQRQQEHHQQQQQLQPRHYSIFCNSPSIGLSLSLSNDSQVIVTNVAPQTLNDVSNNYSMIRPRDVLVGVNGKTFHELVGTETVMNYGRGPLHFVVDYLRTVERPMSVMFERGVDNTDANFLASASSTAVTTSSSSTTAAVSAMTTGVENDSENDDNDSDDDKEEADIDWYDAKVLSFSAKSRLFSVQFLGDDKDVIYEMSLLPKLVRPSVRAWTRRALSLINLDEKLVPVGGYADADEGYNGANETIDCGLPPSTELPEDSKQVEILSHMENKEWCISSGSFTKLVEYSQLLEKQQFLATRLSPLVHENDKDEDDGNDVADHEDHPGPLADSNYVEHLCNCMKEIRASCDWMICESAVLDILRKNSMNEKSSTLKESRTDMKEIVASTASDVTTKISREIILHFLVNGSRFLNRLLSLDPDNKVCMSSQSTRKGGGHRGRKKGRIGDAAPSTNHYATRSSGNFDSIFDNMLTRAMLSNETLYSLVNQLLNNASLTNTCNRVWIVRTLTHSLSLVLMKLWTPVTNWISKTEDMINGASGQFYTIEDVESHVQDAEVKGTSLALINLTDGAAKLLAKLNRAQHFEAEILNAIGACTHPVVATNNGLTKNDDCMLTLQRLKDEAMSTTPPSMRAERTMQNINPLGRSLVNYNSGLVLSSPLTRGVINDAITVRSWVLDLSHANSVRERTGFVQVT